MNRRSPRRRMWMLPLSVGLAALASLLTPVASLGADPSPAAVTNALSFGGSQLSRTHSSLPSSSYPISTRSSGSWNTTNASGWTSGFLPGALWMKYRETRSATWRSQAQSRQAGIQSQQSNSSTHDVGFMIFNSFGNGYKLTGTDSYRQVVLSASSSLAKRYSPVVGMTRSWNNSGTDFRVIVDNMMNLEMLFWAANNGGDPAWRQMAVSHALRTSRDFVRPDGGTYHVVHYDPTSGAVRSKRTHQGASAESTWSRGQAWAIYGFTMAYRETGDVRFLDTARRVSDYYLARLPADSVPYWDFQAPAIPSEPRDSSAAAVAASGLLELSQRETDPSRAAGYRSAAGSMLSSLTSSAYLAQGASNRAILLHGTRNRPAGDFDTGTIWGDYYLLEALLRYRGQFRVDNRPRLEDGAKITLGVGPKRIRNGQRAGFRGRVTGGGEPVPDVIVALEARVGRRWVNFRTLRSGPEGIFETLYRFTRTYRTRTYRFRARIVSQTGSETGKVVSRGGRVKVLGRRLRRR